MRLKQGSALDALIVGVLSFISLVEHTVAFDPYKYQRKSVQCDAIRRAPSLEEVKVEMSYVDIGEQNHDAIIMVHGWPSIWSTWAKQIEAFENEPYRLIVPDLRGFGYSTHPDDFKSSHTMQDLTNDLVCVLEDAKVASAICIGHDWGSQLCYEAARMRPDIFTAVVGLVVPYIPAAGPYMPIKQYLPLIPKLAYQLFFDHQTEEAAKELNQDVRRTLRATMRTVSSPPPDNFLTSETSFLDSWKDVDVIPPVPFLSPEEEDYLVQAFERQGFLHTFGFYTEESRRLSHAFSNEQGNFTLPQPVLSILPTKDPVADWKLAMKVLNSQAFIPNLEVKYFEGAHWVHLENPEPVNNAINGWLRGLRSRAGGHVVDEL